MANESSDSDSDQIFDAMETGIEKQRRILNKRKKERKQQSPVKKLTSTRRQKRVLAQQILKEETKATDVSIDSN